LQTDIPVSINQGSSVSRDTESVGQKITQDVQIMKHQNIRSPLSAWVGGKYQLAKTIIPLIPKHTCYVEPFAGAAWVLFKKPKSTCEVINDINQDVSNIYRVIKNHPEAFYHEMQHIPYARHEFNRQQNVDPTTLTDIQRAARFYYLQKSAYGGKITDAHFGTSTTHGAKLNFSRIEQDIRQAQKRLAQVTIENLNYDQLIKRYDRKETFFYIDPPYWGCEDYYGKRIFTRQDFQVLSDQLKTIKGKFLLSINDTPEIRKIFSTFKIVPAQTSYSLASRNTKKVQELLISNV